jgi:hypothetical protein
MKGTVSSPLFRIKCLDKSTDDRSPPGKKSAGPFLPPSLDGQNSPKKAPPGKNNSFFNDFGP